MAPPSGLAIILGAGPNTGTGIARVLSDPAQGNFAIALLARNADKLADVKAKLLDSHPHATIETFAKDTSAESLQQAFRDVAAHPALKDVKLRVAVFSIKHAAKKPFLTETPAAFAQSLHEYVGGAMVFAQEAIRRFLADHGEKGLADGGEGEREKKGTLIFTGTLGALRTNAEYASYGAGRAGVRMLAQALAKEFSVQGIHVAHTIANGGIADEAGEAQASGKRMSADAVGREYWHLVQQEPALWTHELDMRPAQERF